MIIETSAGLKILKGLDNYEALFIDSTRIDDCIAYLYNNNLRSIIINPFQGYQAENLDFLSRIEDFIEGLSILDEKYDYSVVNRLKKLKSLGFVDNKRDNIYLSNFPNLEILACNFSSRLKGLDTCNKLRNLTLTGFKSRTYDLTDFPVLTNLIDLALFVPNIHSLSGVERLSNLKRLLIFRASYLQSIRSLGELSNTLQELEIDQCKRIIDYDVLGEMKSLRKIILSESGEIENLSFLKKLPSLKLFSFYKTNVLDGDLSYCKDIDFVGFDNKRHYSHKSEGFKKILPF